MIVTILLLVSDPLLRSVMKETFEAEGYVVLPTGTLGAAADILRVSKPTLLVTRTYVEGMPGHDAAKYLRKKCPTMRVLIVGGLLNDERLQDRYAVEGFEVFPKPYTAEQLLEKIREVLSA